MNKTTKFSAIFTATILVAGLIAVGFNNDALAAKPNPVVKPFDCSSSGTFDGNNGTFEQVGNCSHMGKTTFDGTFTPTGGVLVDGVLCVGIESFDSLFEAANGDTITLAITGTQCFFDETGAPVDASLDFCGNGQSHTSTVDGTYTVTSGTGKFFDAEGTGTILASATHCNPDGDTFDSLVSGNIEYAASN